MTLATAYVLVIGGAVGTSALVAAVLLMLFNQRAATFPAWWEATSTAAAFAAATIAVLYSSITLDRERDREREWQAARIAAWPEPIEFAYRKVDGLDEINPVAIRGLSASVRNASDLPVTEVLITFRLALVNVNDHGVALLEGSSTVGTERLSILPPANNPIPVRLRDVSHGAPIDVPDPEEADRTELLIDLQFRDSTGQRWSRASTGTLTLL